MSWEPLLCASIDRHLCRKARQSARHPLALNDFFSGRPAVSRQSNTEQKHIFLQKGLNELPHWVFLSEAGTRLDESNVRKVMTRVLKNARLPLHFTPHCLRHTYASLMLQQGEPIAYIQRMLGHSSIQLTVDTYGKWLPIGNHGAVDRLDGSISESGSKMVANREREAPKLWSWREELNLQPVVYKDQFKKTLKLSERPQNTRIRSLPSRNSPSLCCPTLR
jgi:hypothetical protein